MFVPWRWNCWRNTWLKLTWSPHSDQSSWCFKTFLQEFRCGSICVFPQFVPRVSVGFFFFLCEEHCISKTVLIASFLCFVDFRYVCIVLVHRRAALATWITHLCTHRVSHRWFSWVSFVWYVVWHSSNFLKPWEFFQLLRWGHCNAILNFQIFPNMLAHS